MIIGELNNIDKAKKKDERERGGSFDAISIGEFSRRKNRRSQRTMMRKVSLLSMSIIPVMMTTMVTVVMATMNSARRDRSGHLHPHRLRQKIRRNTS